MPGNSLQKAYMVKFFWIPGITSQSQGDSALVTSQFFATQRTAEAFSVARHAVSADVTQSFPKGSNSNSNSYFLTNLSENKLHPNNFLLRQ